MGNQTAVAILMAVLVSGTNPSLGTYPFELLLFDGGVGIEAPDKKIITILSMLIIVIFLLIINIFMITNYVLMETSKYFPVSKEVMADYRV